LGSNRTCYDSIIARYNNSWYQNMAERLLVNGAGLALFRGHDFTTIVAQGAS